MEANSTGGQGSRRAVAPSDDDDYAYITTLIVAQNTWIECVDDRN